MSATRPFRLHCLALALFAAAVRSAALPEVAPPHRCVSGVHIIVARATSEPPGEGVTGNVANMIVNAIPDSNSIGLPYPASLEEYFTSVVQGREALTARITQHVENCPETGIVLLGYSQGAQVVADTLMGCSEEYFEPSEPLPERLGKHVLATVLFADPTHVIGEPWDSGTATKNGIFPRAKNGPGKAYEGRMISYCDRNDKVCASGTNMTIHYENVLDNGIAGAEFVISTLSKL